MCHAADGEEAGRQGQGRCSFVPRFGTGVGSSERSTVIVGKGGGQSIASGSHAGGMRVGGVMSPCGSRSWMTSRRKAPRRERKEW